MSHAEPQFSIARKGYRPDEVEAFVATINGTIDDLNAQLGAIQRDLTDAYDEAAEIREQLNAANGELEKANQELGVAREQEEALRMTLVSASRTKDEMLAKAQLESENMVADATAHAEAILAAARDEASRVEAATSQTQTELEHRMASVESDLRTRANAFETQLAAAHEDGLASISRLDALYQASSHQLTTLLETAHREIEAGRREMAGFETSSARAEPPSPRVEATPQPPAQSAESEHHQSALDKVASLMQPARPDPAATTSQPDPVASPPEDVPSPMATQARLDGAETPPPTPDGAAPLPEAGLSGATDRPTAEATAAAVEVAEAAAVGVAEAAAVGVAEAAAVEVAEAAEDDRGPEEPLETSDSEVPDEPAVPRDEVKPSFYNRRSGRLPRLGDDKQRDTTSSMASLRDKS